MLIAIYLLAIVTANLLIAVFGPQITLINAVLFVGLDLTTRDLLHERWHGQHLRLRMLALIGTGAGLTWLLNSTAAPIALASCVAFGAAGVADAGVFSVLHRRDYWLRVNGSNIVGAAVDSLVFPTLAFHAFLPVLIVGQFVAKVGGGFAWSVVLHHGAGVASRRGGSSQ